MLALYRYFVAIVDHGGFTAASVALGVTQPTLTRSLQTLEFRLGVQLLDRSGGATLPTAQGMLLLRRARLLLAENRSVIEDLQQLSAGRLPMTYINGSPMTGLSLIPNILRRMAHAHPEFPVSVRGDIGADYSWKLDAILSGELDVALTLYDPLIQRENLRQELLFEPEVRIVVGRTHPAADDSEVTLEQLRELAWILPPAGSGSRAVVESEFAQHGLELPRRGVEISDWGVAFDLVESGDFVMAIPFHPSCFNNQLARLRILPVHFTVRSLAIGMVSRPLSAGRPGTRAVMAMIRRTVAESSGTQVSEAGSPRVRRKERH